MPSHAVELTGPGPASTHRDVAPMFRLASTNSAHVPSPSTRLSRALVPCFTSGKKRTWTWSSRRLSSDVDGRTSTRVPLLPLNRRDPLFGPVVCRNAWLTVPWFPWSEKS